MLALALATLLTPAHAAEADEPAPVTPAGVEAARPNPKVVVGPTVAIGTPLLPGKPVGVSIGVQAIVPHRSWRFGVEAFTGTPLPSFAPQLGGDVGVGLVDRNGLGGALAVYARHTFETDAVPASTQAGPGLLLLSKVAPTVVVVVPFVVWVDTATAAVTPVLSVKAVLGVPHGR